MKTVASMIGLLALGTPLSAAEIHVPGDFPTIQQAIDAARPGDEVVCAPATYIEAFTMSGHVTVRSAAGSDVTILDGSGLPISPVTILGTANVLEGFTVTGGTGTPGRLVEGGALRMNGEATIRSCFFVGNNADIGGAIGMRESVATVEDSRFYVNGADEGGAIWALDSCLVLDRCQFISNGAQSGGGAVFVSNELTITECTFADNLAPSGGGVSFQGDRLSAVRSNFVANRVGTSGSGGAVLDAGNEITFVNCRLTDNRAAHGAAVLLDQIGASAFVNCTVMRNNGLAIESEMMPQDPIEIRNSVLYNNSTNPIWNIDPVVTFSNVQFGWPGEGNIDIFPQLGGGEANNWTADAVHDTFSKITTLTNSNATWAPGSLIGRTIIPDQAFSGFRTIVIFNSETTIDVVGALYANLVLAGDAYGLPADFPVPGSPGIDAGRNTDVPDEVVTDVDGNPRFVDDPDAADCPQGAGVCGLGPLVDMGARELQVDLPCFEVTSEEISCGASGDFFSYTVAGVNTCTGAVMTFVFPASGGAVGEPICFTANLFCCEQEFCMIIPDCEADPVSGDLDGDGLVGINDILILLSAWGWSPDGPPDFDADGLVGMTDLLFLLGQWSG